MVSLNILDLPSQLSPPLLLAHPGLNPHADGLLDDILKTEKLAKITSGEKFIISLSA